jgi:hypothetical protein
MSAAGDTGVHELDNPADAGLTAVTESAHSRATAEKGVIRIERHADTMSRQ